MIGRMLFAIISGQMLGSVVSGLRQRRVRLAQRARRSARGVGAVAGRAVAWLAHAGRASAAATPRRRLVRRALRPRPRQPEGAVADRRRRRRGRMFFYGLVPVHGRSCCWRPRDRPSCDRRRHRPRPRRVRHRRPALRLRRARRSCVVRRSPHVPDRLGRPRLRATRARRSLPTWWLGALAMFVAGVSFYMLHNSMQTEATELAPSARGSAVALFACGFFIGQGHPARSSSAPCCTASGARPARARRRAR